MPKVFILQESLPERDRPPKDLSSLDRYGEPVYILHRFDRGTDNPSRSLSKFRAAFRELDPEKDFILNLGSDPVSSVLAGIALSELEIDELTFLKWERSYDPESNKSGYYVPVKVLLFL